MVDSPSVPGLGIRSQAEFGALEEMAAAYVNQVGVPDTKATLDVNINAVLPKFYRDCFLEINSFLLGLFVPSGLAGLLGEKWIPGNSGAQTVSTADITFYSIPTPSYMAMVTGPGDEIGATTLISDDSAPANRYVFAVENCRTGVTPIPTEFVTKSLRTHRNLNYHADGASATAANGDQAVAFLVRMNEWNQDNTQDLVFASHRSYNSANESGPSFNLGWELGLAAHPTSGVPEDYVLYYRDFDEDFLEQRVYAIDAAGDYLSLSPGVEYMIGFRRIGLALEFHINGQLVATQTLGALSKVGTDGTLRIVVSGTYDGSKNANSSFRQIAVWDATVDPIPDFDQLLTYYRVAAGFLPKS